MKLAISLIAVLVCAPALRASDFESMRRMASFELAGIAASPAVSIPGPAVPERAGFIFRGSFCWQRGKDLNAERMGMPFSFCVDSMEISGDLFEKPLLNISGTGLNGAFALKIGPPSDGLYKATAVIFKSSNGSSCSAGEAAYIEFYVLADARGKIVAEPFLKAFYGRTPDICRPQWKYGEIRYEFTAL